MISSHIYFSEKQRQLFNFFVMCVGMSVYVLVCVIPPTAILPNSISTRLVAIWRKTQRFATTEDTKRTKSEIAVSI